MKLRLTERITKALNEDQPLATTIDKVQGGGTRLSFPHTKFKVSGNNLSASLQSLYLDAPPKTFAVNFGENPFKEAGNTSQAVFKMVSGGDGMAQYASEDGRYNAVLSSVEADPWDRL
jgi:hypothetical protein